MIPAAVINAARCVFSVQKVLNTPLIDFEDTETFVGLEKGYLAFSCKLEDKKISLQKMCKILSKESITCVKRNCCSLWKYVPSGIASIFTYIVAGTTVRHEFCFIHTTNYVVLVQVTVPEGKSIDNAVTEVSAFMANTQYKKFQVEQKFRNTKSYNREMKVLRQEDDDLADINFQKLLKLIVLWQSIFKVKGYSAFSCKPLARSILYFSKKDYNLSDIIYSLLGIFTDKPFYIPHLEMIAIEKTTFHTTKLLSSQFDQAVKLLKNQIESIKSGNSIELNEYQNLQDNA